MKPFIWSVTTFLFLIFFQAGAFGEDLFDTQASNQHFQTGLNFYYQKNFEAAIKEFKTAISIDPENVKAYYYLGYTFYQTQNFREAFKQFETAYQINKAYTPIPPGNDFPLAHSPRENPQG
jgi:Tfp pilus assembly protein PilF